ncbi:MAG: hypothetical protein ABFC94_14230 [Syntrophomonas sp.]
MVNNITDIKRLREYGCEDSMASKVLIKLLNNVQVYVPDEKISIVYPKRLFGNTTDKIWDETDLEIVLLTTDDQIIITSLADDQGFVINIYDKSEIASIVITGNITEYDHQVSPSAILRFKDGNDLILDSAEDANEYWVKGYTTAITSIIKQLL